MIRDFGLVKWLLVIFMGAFGALLGLFLTIEATGAFKFLPDPFGLEISRQALGFIAGAIVGAIVGYLVAYWLVARERMHGATGKPNVNAVGSDDDEWSTASSTGRRGTLALLLFGGSLIALLVAGWMVDRGSADTPEVTLALVLLAGVVILLVAIAALAVVISEFGLAGNKAAFGLPPGTVRAIIALALVLIFAIISVFLLTSTRVPDDEFVSTGLTQAQYEALSKDENVDLVSVTLSTDADGDTRTDADGDTLYDVRVVRSGEQPGELTQQLTLQLMAILGTLIAAVVGFYFGSGGSTTRKDARDSAFEPDKPDKPAPDKPDKPAPDKPDKPEPDKPDKPDEPDKPEPDKPDKPEPDKPEPDKPDKPEPDKPEPDKPDKPAARQARQAGARQAGARQAEDVHDLDREGEVSEAPAPAEPGEDRQRRLRPAVVADGHRCSDGRGQATRSFAPTQTCRQARLGHDERE